MGIADNIEYGWKTTYVDWKLSPLLYNVIYHWKENDLFCQKVCFVLFFHFPFCQFLAEC